LRSASKGQRVTLRQHREILVLAGWVALLVGCVEYDTGITTESSQRIGDHRQTEVALDKGRRLLESLPYPENLEHHFVVDPTKFDFYAMDCYRALANNKMAENLADEVIQASTDFDGRERAPMRLAEARITLGVIRAREGDLEGAVDQGQRALTGERRSLPSLLMVTRDLTKVLNDQYPAETQTQNYLDQITALTAVPATT
jgi:hypothetical protein